MNSLELKTKMMKLWKDTFHDSDDYISLVFDTYFDPEMVEYFEEGGRLISALLGVEYYFGNGRNNIKALYLCGLATSMEFRHHGIMNSLIEKICKRAKEKGYAFAFLIPASEMLRIYYNNKGFFNAMYRVEDRYTDVHNFENDYKGILNNEDPRVKNIKLNYYENLCVEKIEKIDDNLCKKLSEFIHIIESDISSYFVLKHSPKDVAAIIQENIISGGEIYICKNDNNEITGILFSTMDERKRILIPKIYNIDNCSYFKLLDKIKKVHPDSSIGVMCFPEETNRRALWSKAYSASNPDGGMASNSYGMAERVYEINLHAKPYGMIKILDLHEILKFIAKDRNDLKFSILVREANPDGSALKCDIRNGEAHFENVDRELVKSFNGKPEITVLTLNDFCEILLRKKDSSNLIMEALGIPRLALNMALMLD